MVELFEFENQILHQVRYFCSFFLNEYIYINAVQIHVTSHTTNRLAWLTSLLLHFFKLEYLWLRSDWFLLCKCTHAETESILHAHKDICKEFNYYGLLYKCVPRHFIIKWNLTSYMLQVDQSFDLICDSYLYVLQSQYR